jgi:hypothetical protein
MLWFPGWAFLFLNKYWECHEITEYLKSKHVKQMKLLMAMRNMWWHLRSLFGLSDSFSKLPDRMLDKSHPVLSRT